MTGFICPYSVRDNRFRFLLCRRISDGKIYRTATEAAEAFCAHQHHCPKTGRAENTEAAKDCFEYHSS